MYRREFIKITSVIAMTPLASAAKFAEINIPSIEKVKIDSVVTSTLTYSDGTALTHTRHFLNRKARKDLANLNVECTTGDDLNMAFEDTMCGGHPLEFSFISSDLDVYIVDDAHKLKRATLNLPIFRDLNVYPSNSSFKTAVILCRPLLSAI